MNSETKQCQNCKQSFVIEPEDFAFYERIKVPPPTWCPECRIIRRMAFRDYRVLYKRKSDRTGDTIFSIFHPQSPVKVWERDQWWSNDWDACQFAKDIDFSKPFLSQIYELFLTVPLPSQTVWNMVNSDFCTGASGLKNCYLVFTATNCEDCAYSADINQTKNSFDVTKLESSELCYESFALTKCYKAIFSSHCEECTDIWFSRGLIGCSSCFGCVNLRNKQYYIFNEPYSKEEYERKIKEFLTSSYNNLILIKEKFNKFALENIRKFFEGRHNVNVSGEYINNSKNVFSSYHVTQAEDSKFIQLFITPSAKDCYDCTLWGQNVEKVYECSSIGEDSYGVKFSCRCYKGSRDCEYSLNSIGCSNLFGCVGMNKKQYCILNKQYTKEEYEELIPRIIKHMNDMPYMDKKGRIYKYGEFFPSEFSPYAYNESLAGDYFPISKEEIINSGFIWRDPDIKEYEVTKKSEDLPDCIEEVPDSITKEIIGCAHEGECAHQCTTAFRIIPEELSFYRRVNLPLPRLCPNCRHCERIIQRNPLKLWHRQCMCDKSNHQHKGRCTNEFETSYSPERKETIYCESCYNSEVV